MRSDTVLGKVLLIRNDEAWSLTFRVLKPLVKGVIVDSTPYREFLLNQRPNARILEEIPISVANHDGAAFDLRWKLAAGITASARVAFIPCAAGVLEFSLLTTTDRFLNAQADFNRLLVSFRAAPNSTVNIQPPSKTS